VCWQVELAQPIKAGDVGAVDSAIVYAEAQVRSKLTGVGLPQ
jgi:hypothetical protein